MKYRNVEKPLKYKEIRFQNFEAKVLKPRLYLRVFNALQSRQYAQVNSEL